MTDRGLQEGPLAKPRLFYGHVVVAVSALSMALIFSVHYAFGIFFEPLSAAFGWTRATIAGPFSLVWIMQGLLSIVMGGFNDKFGPRVVLSICAVLVGGGYMLTSQIHAVWQLYLYYGVLVGAGLGGTFVPLTSTASHWFIKYRGVMTGIVASGVGLGALVGPPIANWLINRYSWRTSYLVLGAIVLLGVLVAAQFLRKDPVQMGTKPYGAGEPGFENAAAPAVGLTMGQAASSAQFWLVSVVFFCYGYTWTAILVHLAPHIIDLGFTSTRAAGVLSALGGTSIVAKVLMGRLADKIGYKQVYILSLVLMVASLVWLILMPGLWALLLFAFAFGFAYGGLASAHAPLVAWLFGLRNHGLIFGVCFNGFTLGCAVGPLVAGYIYDLHNSYRSAFILCAVLSFAGLLLMLPLKPAFPEPAPRKLSGAHQAV